MACVLGCGSALLDQLARVPEAFVAALPGQKGGTLLVDDAERRRLLAALPTPPEAAPGGSAANTVVGLAHLGVPTRLLAKLGMDAAGDAYRGHVEAAGIGTTALKYAADLPTGTCLSLITPDGERTMRTCLGAAAALAADEIGPADVRGCSHLLAEGYLLHNRAVLLHILRLGRAAGCQICLDLSAPEVVHAAADLLPTLLTDYVDMVFANEAEAAAFAGTRDPAGALGVLAQHCDLAVVKLGPEGALLCQGGQTVHVPAEKVEACDTTGAGDLWAAGFLYGRLQGGSLQTAGRLGAAVAAAVVCVVGAALPAATWARLRRRLADIQHEA